MAEVFLGYLEQGSKRTPVAIKRLLPQLVQDEEIVALFHHEAELLLQFNHPNVVRALEVGQVRDNHFIAMEYIHGASLEGLKRRAVERGQDLSLNLLARIGSDVCDVLGYVHRVAGQIIHRDVSPQNIMLTYAGRVKVLDFGVAKDLDSLSRTRPAALAGKTAYLSPEQVRQDPGLDLRTDIYSLGAVVFELATGRKPFMAQTELDTMLAIIKQPSPDPRDLDHRIPDEFAELIMRAMHKDRAQRFQSAEQMGAALLVFLEHRRAEVGQRELARTLRDLFPPKHTMRLKAAEAQKKAAALSEPEPASEPESGPEPAPGPMPPAEGPLQPTPPESDPVEDEDDQAVATSAPLPAGVEPRRSGPWRWLVPLAAIGAGAALAGVIGMQLSRPANDPAGGRVQAPPPPSQTADLPAPGSPNPDSGQAAGQSDAVPDAPPLAEIARAPRMGMPAEGLANKKRPWPGLGRQRATRPGNDPREDEILQFEDLGPGEVPVEDVELEEETVEETPPPPSPEPTTGSSGDGVDPTPPPDPEPTKAVAAVNPPPKPTYQPPEVIQKRRIAGHDPAYPPMARKAKLRATVLVKIFIEPDGSVGFTKFLKGHPVFEAPVLEAIGSWRFSPHSINGRPVGTYTVYKFVFQID